MPLDSHLLTPAKSPAVAASGTFASASLLIAALVLAAGFGASAVWGDGGYWAVGIAGAGAISLAASLRRLGGGAAPIAGGMSVATDTLTGAFFLAVPGAIFASGHDGLAYALGLGAGCLLMQLLIAPRFAQLGANSLPALLTRRFSSRAVDLIGLSIITASMVGLLVAGLMASGLVGMRLLGVDFATATIAAACAALACFVVRGAGGTSTVNGMLYPLLLVALLVPLVILSAQWHGLPVPQLAYANSIWQLQGLEENLLEQELADPSFMRPMLTAFLSVSPINFAGITLGLAAGVAVLPSLLAPPLATTTARNARHTALWGLGFSVLVLALAPAVAVYARQEIATLIAERTALSDLPAWIFTYGKLGLVQVCGEAATSADAVAQACAALPDAASTLRLQDVSVDPDVVTLALPEIAGLSGVLMGLLALAVLATVLVTAHAPLSVIVRALGLTIDGPDQHVRGMRLASYAVATAVIAASTTLALLRPAGIVDVATWAVAVAAAGLFPAVVGALWWRGANAAGAAAGMLAGVAVMVLYLAGRHYFAVPFFEATAALSSGGASGLEYFGELKEAWLDAEPGVAKDAAWLMLDAHARSIADWFGISGPATVLLALPVGFLTLVIVSLATLARCRSETAP
ncbi:MAG: sodium:solute symporter family transporter [Hyphomicrobium sp.]